MRPADADRNVAGAPDGDAVSTDGKRALRGRLGTLSGLNDKLATYESLLSTRLDGFRDRMASLQANVTRGILALEADEDAQAA